MVGRRAPGPAREGEGRAGSPSRARARRPLPLSPQRPAAPPPPTPCLPAAPGARGRAWRSGARFPAEKGGKGRERRTGGEGKVGDRVGARGRGKKIKRENRASVQFSAFPPSSVPRRQPAQRTNGRPLRGWGRRRAAVTGARKTGTASPPHVRPPRRGCPPPRLPPRLPPSPGLESSARVRPRLSRPPAAMGAAV